MMVTYFMNSGNDNNNNDETERNEMREKQLFKIFLIINSEMPMMMTIMMLSA